MFYSLSQNHLMNLQTSLQTADSSNDTAVQGGDGKIRCLNAEPEVPKCEVRLLTGNATAHIFRRG